MKKFVACLLALSMSFATIGCGDADKADPDTSEEGTPGDTEAHDADDDADADADET